jgi:DNA replication protein DnaC
MTNLTFEERRAQRLKEQPEREVKSLQHWNENNLRDELIKLPPRIRRDIEHIPFPEIDIVKGTYLCGKVGSGKTIRAIFLMLADLRNGYVKGSNLGSYEAIFISVPELLFEFKRLYSNHNETEDGLTEDDLVKKYSNIGLLVLDDFGVEKTTDWSFQLLYLIINRRYEYMKKTIFTSNFTLEQLAEKLGDDRLPSRIQQMCEIILFNNKDYRSGV